MPSKGHSILCVILMIPHRWWGVNQEMRRARPCSGVQLWPSTHRTYFSETSGYKQEYSNGPGADYLFERDFQLGKDHDCEGATEGVGGAVHVCIGGRLLRDAAGAVRPGASEREDDQRHFGHASERGRAVDSGEQRYCGRRAGGQAFPEG